MAKARWGQCVGLTLAAALLVGASPLYAQIVDRAPPSGPPPSAMPQGGPPPGGFPPIQSVSPTAYAVYINDGIFAHAQSRSAALRRGRVQNTFASGLQIVSSEGNLNGIYVRGGRSAFTLAHSDIALSGHGSDDNSGIGAGALVGAQGALVLHDVRITTNGAARAAVTSTDGGVLRVYDSTLIANGGPLPADYVPHIGPGMMEPPPPLGISGTARASNATNGGRSYFYGSTIVADGWGAISTDMAGPGVYVEVNDSTVRTLSSGYGTYADNGCEVVFNNSDVDTASFTGIIAGQGIIRLNDTRAISHENGVMIHSVMGSDREIGRLSVVGGSIAAEQAAVFVKSANAEITLKHVVMTSQRGPVIRSVVNEDSNATRVSGPVSGIDVSLVDMALNGDISHEDIQRGMTITMTGSQLRGAIRHATLAIDAGSRWTATADSTIMLAEGAEIGSIDALPGVEIVAQGGAQTGVRRLSSGGQLRFAAR